MAKVTASPLVSAISGKVGGVVFRGAGNSATVQASPQVTRGETPAQAAQRQRFAAAAAAWLELPANARSAWDFAAAQGYYGPGPNGARYASGRALFVAWQSIGYTTRRGDFDTWPLMPPWRSAIVPTVAATSGVTPTLTVSAEVPTGYAFASAWLARATSLSAFPSRPTWRQLYGEHDDPLLSWAPPAPPASQPHFLSLGELFAEKFPEQRAGLIWVFRGFVSYDHRSIAPFADVLFQQG